ncbi:MAG: hypothetical protein U1E73_10975 [Planctomycetota bacterium]
MRTLVTPLLFVGAILAQDAPHLALKVLYAGVPDHARTAGWREFLQPKVDRFTVIDVTQLTREAAGDADVVILDCPDPIVRDAAGKPTRIAVPRPQAVDADFGLPTIVVGGMAMITDGLHLKSNWL